MICQASFILRGALNYKASYSTYFANFITFRHVTLSGAKGLYDNLRDPSLRSGNHDWVRKATYLICNADVLNIVKIRWELFTSNNTMNASKVI